MTLVQHLQAGKYEQAMARADELRLDRARTMGCLMRDRRLQTLIYAILMLFGGYALFAGSFVGTPNDCAMIFFWDFGIDLGAEAITSLAAQLKAR